MKRSELKEWVERLSKKIRGIKSKSDCTSSDYLSLLDDIKFFVRNLKKFTLSELTFIYRKITEKEPSSDKKKLKKDLYNEIYTLCRFIDEHMRARKRVLLEETERMMAEIRETEKFLDSFKAYT